jgi:cytochrome c-type biogenesis protein CcsB
VTVNSGLAHLSDGLFAAAIGAYVVAMIGFCAEYAFGRRAVERAAAAARRAEGTADAGRVLVGAAVSAAAEGAGTARAAGAVPSDAGGPAGAAGQADGGGDRPAGSVPSWKSSRFVASGQLGVWCARVGMACMVVGTALHTGSVVARGLATDRVPWGNMYEFTSAMCLVAAVGFLVVSARVRPARQLGLFVAFPVVVAMFLAGTVLYAKAGPLVPALHSYWLAIHVSAAIIATGVFMVSFVATALYLVRERYDRLTAAGVTPTRFPVTMGGRLPRASTLDTVAYRTVAFAFPIWTFGIVAGALWAEAAWGRYWGWDPKETWAFIAWIVYAGYLHARATAGWKGAKAGWINVLGFGAMIFNFFVVNIVVSGLHSYAGLS